MRPIPVNRLTVHSPSTRMKRMKQRNAKRPEMRPFPISNSVLYSLLRQSYFAAHDTLRSDTTARRWVR